MRPAIRFGRRYLPFLLLALPVAAWAGAPGEVRNLEVTGYDPATGNISLSFEPACNSTDTHIEFGLLQDVATYAWSGQVCGIGVSGVYDRFNPGPGSIFFVLVGNDGVGVEGSYGVSLIGGVTRERPEDTLDPECAFIQDLNQTCEIRIDLFETIRVADLPVVLPPVVLQVVEAIGVTDTAAFLPPMVLEIAETVRVSDTAAVVPPVVLEVSEGIGVTDAPAALPSVFVQVAEAIGVTDAPAALPSVFVQVAEAIGVTDTAAVVPPVVLEVSEGIGVTDAPAALPSVFVQVAEVIGVADAPEAGTLLTGEGIESDGALPEQTLIRGPWPGALRACRGSRQLCLELPAKTNPAYRAEEVSTR